MSGVGIFFITDQDGDNIRAAAERARARPIAWETLQQAMPKDPHAALLKLEDRCPEHERPESEHVVLPFGYRISISYEQQPAGLCLHISMSSPNAGKIPRPEAVVMVLAALDVSPSAERHNWIEEFREADGSVHHAINVVAVMEPADG